MTKDLDWIPESWASYKDSWKIAKDFADNLSEQIFGKTNKSSLEMYLKRKLGERDADYEMRLALASFDGRVETAILDASALLSQHLLDRRLITDDIAKNLQNVDRVGTNFPVWLDNTVIELLIYGCWAWFVCLDEEHGWYLEWVDPDSIASPQYTVIDKQERLTAFSVRGIERVADGLGYKDQLYFIRHELVEEDGELRYRYSRWEDWEGANKSQESRYALVPIRGQQYTYVTDANGRPLNEFPLVWLNSKGEKHLLSMQYPYFSTLITLNRVQFNKESELNLSESNCNIPTLKNKHIGGRKKKEEQEDIEIGANAILNVPHSELGADVSWMEIQGTGIAITHQRNQDRSEAMDRVAKQFLTGNESEKTAFQIGVELDATRSKLITASTAIQDALQKTFRLAHQYTSPEPVPDNIEDWIQLKQEVLRPPMSDEKARVIIDLHNLGLIPKRSQVMRILQKANYISNDIGKIILDELEASEASQILPVIEQIEEGE